MVDPPPAKIESPVSPPPVSQEQNVSPIPESDLRKLYYTWQQALINLQLEDEELKDIVTSGVLVPCVQGGRKWFKRSDIDALKKGKMIEPTMVMEEGKEDDKDILDDDEEDMFPK
jgi:hypothetical protein